MTPLPPAGSRTVPQRVGLYRQTNGGYWLVFNPTAAFLPASVRRTLRREGLRGKGRKVSATLQGDCGPRPAVLVIDFHPGASSSSPLRVRQSGASTQARVYLPKHFLPAGLSKTQQATMNTRDGRITAEIILQYSTPPEGTREKSARHRPPRSSRRPGATCR